MVLGLFVVVAATAIVEQLTASPVPALVGKTRAQATQLAKDFDVSLRTCEQVMRRQREYACQ